MRAFLLAVLFVVGIFRCSHAQQILKGTIVSASEHLPLSGASVWFKDAKTRSVSDINGAFSITATKAQDTLFISYIGFKTWSLKIDRDTPLPLTVKLEPLAESLQAVTVSTGFYTLPLERTTGSFSKVNQDQLNRSVTTGVLERLEGLVSGLQFVKGGSSQASDIRVRGLATINSDRSPLIVLDNFPYEGDINTINPNDVESITVLKDAAAASIWGARAGNGVIVITTRQGRYNQKSKISFNSSVTVGQKPDLHYDQRRLPSETVMQIEKSLFETQGVSSGDPLSPVPEYVELLIRQRDGSITGEEFSRQEDILKRADVFSGAEKSLYQQSISQQYNLQVNGGGGTYRYYGSAGYDRLRSNVRGDDNSRLNINLQNTWNVLKSLEITGGIWYTNQHTSTNGLEIADLSAGNNIGISPYMRLQDEAGNALSIIKDYRLAYVLNAEPTGLLDWRYRPLDEIKFSDNKGRSEELRLNSGLNHTLLKGLNIGLNYQYIHANARSESYYSPESYYVRNLVNKFTQADNSRIIPYSGIFNAGPSSETTTHSGRVQLNYNYTISSDHTIAALLGSDIRGQVIKTAPGYTLYDYKDDLLTGTTLFDYTKRYPVRPSGTARIPAPPSQRNKFTDRYLSYFGNASYTYLSRYTLSASARWDGSNLFGVKANQKGTPLWSAGTSWELSKEKFFNVNWIQYLRLRITYGSSGNVNKLVSAYPTVTYVTDDVTNLLSGVVKSAGNPSLRWEQVNTTNAGVDFSLFGRRIEGSVDYYVKNGKDLIGEDFLAPSTGIITGGTASATNLTNYADMRTRGLDLKLSTFNIRGKVNWQSTIMFSYTANKITNFKTNPTNAIYNYTNAPAAPVIGRSRDVVYAIPWQGLDHDSGMPLVFINNQKSTDYAGYYNSLSLSDLLDEGVSVPPYYGSILNNFGYKGFNLSAMIGWKAGYVFRRSSMLPTGEIYGNYHMDYFNRWKKPGDEVYTDVPARMQAGGDTYSGTIYQMSQALVTKGDHIRLQDVNLSYLISRDKFRHLPVEKLRVYAYARNLAILWRANKHKIDPDYNNAYYPAPRTFALGIQIDL